MNSCGTGQVVELWTGTGAANVDNTKVKGKNKRINVSEVTPYRNLKGNSYRVHKDEYRY